MTKHATNDYVYMAYARGLFDYLEENGTAATVLAAKAGIDIQLLDDPDAVFSNEGYCTLWEAAIEHTGNENLGLLVGEVLRPGKYGILGYAMLNSLTLKEALNRQRRYQDLVGKSGHSALVVEADTASLQWHSHLARRSRHIGEEHLASWRAFAAALLGMNSPPLGADFVHPEPEDLSHHRRLFGDNLHFNASCTALHFPMEYLDRPLREKNPELQRMLDTQAEKLLLALAPTPDKAVDRVRKRICESLINGTPTLEQIAASLDTAPRSLQRELASAGWSFKDLLDDVRQKTAFHHMQQGELSILDIAFTLGFSEQSPFQRAFKRWTGNTPGQYLEQIRNQG